MRFSKKISTTAQRKINRFWINISYILNLIHILLQRNFMKTFFSYLLKCGSHWFNNS